MGRPVWRRGGGIRPPRGGQPPSLRPSIPSLAAPGPWAAGVRGSPALGAAPAAADPRFAASEVSPLSPSLRAASRSPCPWLLCRNRAAFRAAAGAVRGSLPAAAGAVGSGRREMPGGSRGPCDVAREPRRVPAGRAPLAAPRSASPPFRTGVLQFPCRGSLSAFGSTVWWLEGIAGSSRNCSRARSSQKPGSRCHSKWAF